MTFGVEICYIVTPLAKQREIMEKLIYHWQYGYGARYNPIRGKALEKVRIMGSLDETIADMTVGDMPLVIGTSSKERPGKMISFSGLRHHIGTGNRPSLLLFGTGWGLTDEMVGRCDLMLEPIKGSADYNHLSLRVAFGIILDRIFGH